MRIEDLHKSDVGRPVIYTAGHGETETGVITSWNSVNIFVRYGAELHSKATTPSDLVFRPPTAAERRKAARQEE